VSDISGKADISGQVFTGDIAAPKITASTGVLFGTDTAAANTLDDYEEGAWTPSTTAQANVTDIVINSATYTKIGNMVFAQISGSFSVTSAAGLDTFIIYTVPFAQDSYGSQVTGGGGSVQAASSNLNVNPAVRDFTTSDSNRASLEFISYASGSHIFQIAIMYRVA